LWKLVSWMSGWKRGWSKIYLLIKNIMDEIKVKAYGLFNVKKKTYIITQIIAAIVLVLFFISTYYHEYALSKILWIDDKFIVLFIFIIEVFETYFILKRFKKKELELKNKKV